MKKIKVLHLTSTRYGIGGVEKLLLDMVDKYDSTRFEISYCNLFCDKDGEGVFPRALKAKNVSYFQIMGKRWYELPKIVFNLISLFRKQNFDIVHLHMLQATILGGFAASFSSGIKTIVTKHYTNNLSKHNQIIKFFDKLFTKRANRVIAISDYVKKDMVKLSVPEEKISVIFNGTDLSSFDRKINEDLKLGYKRLDSEIIIGTVGSLTKRKGHQYLLNAMPELLKKYSNVRLVIIGEGPERENLQILVEKIGIEKNVEIIGFKENVAPYIKEFDLYIHPSIHEPFGIAILEAMAAKRCVIACAVEGIPEIVIDGETGILVSPKNPKDLTSSITYAIENPSKVIQMGELGRNRVQENFNIEKTVRSYEALYL